MLTYWKKEQAHRRFNPGVYVPWEVIGNTGFVIVDTDKSPALSAALEANNRVGGILKLSQETYDSLKKNAATFRPFVPQLVETLKAQRNLTPGNPSQSKKPESAAAVKPVEIKPVASQATELKPAAPTVKPLYSPEELAEKK